MHWSARTGTGRANTVTQRGSVDGLHCQSWQSVRTKVVKAVIAGPQACPLNQGAFPGRLSPASPTISKSSSVGGGRREAHNCPLLAPRYPNCPWKSYCSSDPRAPGRSHSCLDFRGRYLSAGVPKLTTNHCWRECARTGAIVGHVMSRGAGDVRDSSSAGAAARVHLGTC